jgi:hypothetical protein
MQPEHRAARERQRRDLFEGPKAVTPSAVEPLIVATDFPKARCCAKKASISDCGTGGCGAEGEYPKMSSWSALGAHDGSRGAAVVAWT